MNKFKQVYQNRKLDWVSPPKKSPFKRHPVLGDMNLSNIQTEYVMGFSLCPTYSVKQLRRISYIEKTEAKHRHQKLNWFFFRSDRSFPVHRQFIIKNVHNMEAIL